MAATSMSTQSMPRWVAGLQAMVQSLTDRIDRYEQRQRRDSDDVGTLSAYETSALPRQRQADPPRANPDLDRGRVNLTTSGARRAEPDAFGAELLDGINNLNTAGQRADSMLRETRALYNRLSRQLTTEERNEVAAARTRADSVYAMHGRQTPETLPGESPRGYRARLADGLKDFCQPLRRTNLDSLPDSALALAESRIYQDALDAARRPGTMPAGTLRARTYKDEATGHNITEYYGDPTAWLTPFMAPGARVKINRNPVREPQK